MNVPDNVNFQKIFLQQIKADWLIENNVELNVLRLDEIHPIISGTKFFKLKYYLKDAQDKGFSAIASFGGAYSNHIVALAFACRNAGFKSVGIIRGEKPKQLSSTLLNAKESGMQLHFVSRIDYLNKNNIKQNFKNIYWIEEGGYGTLGAQGASEIIKCVKDFPQYTHIICAVGTGTTLAGLIQTSSSNQKVIGVSVMKNNYELQQKIQQLLNKKDRKKSFTVLHNFHFGGYGKCTNKLIDFMHELQQQHQLPTDFVYTAKAFYAAKQIIINKIIPSNSRVLFIHTGGLQGNSSLPFIIIIS
ncbi:MAG: 1-aminocyclopropane-1-carboxylate deaminase/D-cysteine desulfhydrase [Chitinophagaceae bacterium]